MASRFPLTHIPALDGLRGLAVAGVLLFHAEHLDGGYLGVDLFFVLSGFLITTLLLTEWDEHGRIDLKHFWFRRARRLLPAVVGVLAGVALYAWFIADPVELDGIRADALATVAYVANWRAVLTGNGYWDIFTVPSPLEHTWSLAIEEQFYLFWPILVVAVLGGWGKAHRSHADVAPGSGGSGGALESRLAARVLALAVGLTAIGVLLSFVLYEPGTDPSRVYLGTDTRAPAILVGAAFAAWLQLRGPVSSRAARAGIEVVGFVSLVGLGIAWATVGGTSDGLYRGGLFACGLAGVGLLASATHPDRGPLAVALSVAPLRWLGLISYGLYLWHWPVFVLVRRQAPDLQGWGLTAVQISISLVLAIVSYFVLEQPIRKRGLAALPRPVLAPALACAVALLVFVATLGGTDAVSTDLAVTSDRGTPASIPPPLTPSTSSDAGATETGPSSSLDDPGATPGSDTSLGTTPGAGTPGSGTPGSGTPGSGAPGTGAPTTKPGVPGTTAPTTAPPRPPRIMVFGDSVAYYLGESVVANAPSWAIEASNRGVIACGLARSPATRYEDGTIVEADPACSTWPERWAADVAAFDPDVVLVLVGNPPLGEMQFDGAFAPPCDAGFDGWYQREVATAIDVLSSQGARVAIATTPYPRFAFLPRSLDQRVDCMNASYSRAVAGSGGRAALVDLNGYICPGECKTEIGGVPLREDGVHFRDPGAREVNNWLVPKLVALKPG